MSNSSAIAEVASRGKESGYLPVLLDGWAAERPDFVVHRVYSGDPGMSNNYRDLTWRSLATSAAVVAYEIQLRKLPRDATVAVMMPECAEYVIGFMGILRAGRIAVPLTAPQFKIQGERVMATLRDADPAIVLTVRSVEADVRAAAIASLPDRSPEVIVVDDLALDGGVPSGLADYTPGDVAWLQYTAGSTGSPSGVVVSHDNYRLHHYRTADWFERQRDESDELTAVGWLPLHHDMGLVLGLVSPIQCGIGVVSMSPMAFLRRPARWITMMAQHGRVLSGAPNFALDLAVRRTSDADLAGLDLSGIQTILLGSERIQPSSIRLFTEKFAPYGLRPDAVSPGYGVAEATLTITFSQTERCPVFTSFDREALALGDAVITDADSAAGSEWTGCGTAMSEVEVRIVDPNSRVDRGEGKVGEIWTRGPIVADGYWNDPERTERTFRAHIDGESVDGAPWLRTGDLGVLIGDELYVVGRYKDLIVIDGRNHYPEDIERTIRESHPAVSDNRVAAFSVDGGATERLIAVAEVNRRRLSQTGDRTEFRELRSAVLSAVASVHGLRVSDLVLVAPGRIPLTTSGKIRRRASLAYYSDGTFDRLDGDR